MHRPLTVSLLALLMAAFLTLLATETARAAAPVCSQTDPRTGVCLVEATPPDTPPGPGSDPVAGGPKDTGSGSACFFDPARFGYGSEPAGPVACSSEYGYWSNSLGCYVRAMDPQPGPDDPSWHGHTPADGGAVYECYQPLPIDVDVYLWLADPPAPAAAGPSPRQVAQTAVDRMNLHALTIGIVPRPGRDSVGLVGMPVWMWAADPGPSTVGPVTATASAGGVTITATARLNKVTWDMGDGHTVVCRGAGTAYRPSDGRTASPDCGYRYTTSSAGKPGDVFTVTATSDWVVTWQGAGQNGVIRMDGLTRSVQIAVGEAQVLVTS